MAPSASAESSSASEQLMLGSQSQLPSSASAAGGHAAMLMSQPSAALQLPSSSLSSSSSSSSSAAAALQPSSSIGLGISFSASQGMGASQGEATNQPMSVADALLGAGVAAAAAVRGVSVGPAAGEDIPASLDLQDASAMEAAGPATIPEMVPRGRPSSIIHLPFMCISTAASATIHLEMDAQSQRETVMKMNMPFHILDYKEVLLQLGMQDVSGDRGSGGGGLSGNEKEGETDCAPCIPALPFTSLLLSLLPPAAVLPGRAEAVCA